MGWETLGEVRRGRGTIGEVWDELRALEEVRDGSGDPQERPGWVGGPSGRSGTGRETLGEVKDRSRVSPVGSGRDGGPSGRCGTGWGSCGEV